MQQVTRDDCGRVAFKVLGGLALWLSMFWNSLVLPPRSWNASVALRSFANESILILVGLGLLFLRRWAAITLSAVSVLLLAEGGSAWIAWIWILFTPSILTVAFWPSLRRADKRCDLSYVFAAVMISVITEYVAFVRRG
jgi:hypothetical protein